jgi:hypothetical protein
VRSETWQTALRRGVHARESGPSAPFFRSGWHIRQHNPDVIVSTSRRRTMPIGTSFNMSVECRRLRRAGSCYHNQCRSCREACRTRSASVRGSWKTGRSGTETRTRLAKGGPTPGPPPGAYRFVFFRRVIPPATACDRPFPFPLPRGAAISAAATTSSINSGVRPGAYSSGRSGRS